MAIRNTNIQRVDLNKETRSTVQNGSIPIGPTGSSSIDTKYPINLSTPVLGNPRDNTGLVFKYPVKRIEENFIIVLENNWENKIKPGDPLELVRGSLVRPYTVRKIFYDTINDETSIYLFVKRENPKGLEKFIESSGFPTVSDDTFIILNRKVENPNEDPGLLKTFDVEIIPSNTNEFSVKATWDIDPRVSVTRLRWRSIPDVSITSVLDFFILTTGEYSQIPNVSVISDSGVLARIDVAGSISQVEVNNPGSGYTFANVEIIGGGGSGAIVTANISMGSIVSFNVVSGGSGYIYNPEVKIIGDGLGATANVIFLIDTITSIEQGKGYLSLPQVVVDPTYLVGLTGTEISISLSLLNKSRVNYIRVTDGGIGYTGASVSITGSLLLNDATATATIENGSIKSIDVIEGGYDYKLGANVAIIPSGPSGSSADAIANIDLYSQWVYEDPIYFEKSKIIENLKPDILYEMQIVVSEDKYFRGILKYSVSLERNFIYIKDGKSNSSSITLEGLEENLQYEL